MFFRSLGKAYLGEGHEVGQFVSATTISLPHVLAMFVKLVLRLDSVAAELLEGVVSVVCLGCKRGLEIPDVTPETKVLKAQGFRL